MSTNTFIEQLYTNFLGRSSDSAGKSYWEDKLDSGAMNAAQISQSFIESAEFTGVVSPVAQLYYATFNRIPDAGGLAYWMEAFQNGASIEEISNGFVGSQEFQDQYGSAVDDDAFLELLYQNVFNRAPDEEGKANWLNEMDNNGLSRAEVLIGFSNSQEQINAKGEDIKVIVQYQGITGTAPTQSQIDAAIALANPESVIATLYASADYNGEAVPGLSISGVVIDGYVSGATVFIDTNGDGIQNNGEASTTTDEFGNFDFGTDAGFGDLVMSGGTDISTGQAFEGTMTAPSGSTVVNPLTTLVTAISQDSSTSVEDATAAVLNALGLDSDIDILNFDPIAEVTSTTATQAETEAALAIQAAAIQVNTLISQTAALLDGAGVTAGEDDAIEAAYAALADSLAATSSTETVDLTSSTVIEQVIQDAATQAGADDTQTTEIETLSTDASTTIANLNQAIDDAVTTSADLDAALVEMAAIQIVAEDIEDDMESGAQAGDVSSTTDSTTGSALTATVDTASGEVGDTTGDGTSDATDTTGSTGGSSGSTTTPPPADTTAPTFSSAATSTDGATIVLTYNEALSATTAVASNFAVAIGGTGNTVTGVTLSGSTVILALTTTVANGDTVTVGYTDPTANDDANAIQDAAGNDAVTLASTTSVTNNVPVPDTTAPTLSSSSPADEATAIVIGSNIVLTLDEAVVVGTGDIVITNSGNASDTRTIAIGDATQVTISGSTVTINPTADLVSGTAYNVQIASTALKDSAGNAYAGIANATTLNFVTAEAVLSVADAQTAYTSNNAILYSVSDTASAIAGGTAAMLDQATTVTAADASQAAVDLTTADSKTTTVIASTATTITGTSTEVKAAYDANTAATISGLGNEAVTTSNLGVVADVNAIAAETSGIVTARVEHLAAAAQLSALGDATATDALTIKPNGTTTDISALVGLDGKTSVTVDATATTTLTDTTNIGADLTSADILWHASPAIITGTAATFTSNRSSHTVDAANILNDTDLTLAGNATFIVTGLVGDIVSTNGGGMDVTLAAGATNNVAFGTSILGDHSVNADALTDTQTLTLTGTDIASVSLVDGDLSAAAYTGALTVTATTGSNVIVTGAGNDTLTGGGGDDTLTGGGGDDLFTIDLGEDTITDLSGSDDLQQSGSANALATVTADYTATTNTSNTSSQVVSLTLAAANIAVVDLSLATGTKGFYVKGDSSLDATVITGSAQIDTLIGGDFDDTLNGGAGNDQIKGYAGNDTINGGEGVDNIIGDAGNDIIGGDAGNDIIGGDAGNDTITGGLGKDTLTGGADADTFVFASGDTGITVATADTITDFVSGTDKIDFITSVAGTTYNEVDGSANDFAAFQANATSNFTGFDYDIYVEFNHGGDAWVIFDEDLSDDISAGDTFIILTGVDLATEIAVTDFI